MTFAAAGLPKGLRIDPATGRISGRVAKAGTYDVTLTAKNELGEATRNLRIVIGDRIALTPPMGWNSWNCWARDVTQEQVLSSARAMVASALPTTAGPTSTSTTAGRARAAANTAPSSPTRNSPT